MPARHNRWHQQARWDADFAEEVYRVSGRCYPMFVVHHDDDQQRVLEFEPPADVAAADTMFHTVRGYCLALAATAVSLIAEIDTARGPVLNTTILWLDEQNLPHCVQEVRLIDRVEGEIMVTPESFGEAFPTDLRLLLLLGEPLSEPATINQDTPIRRSAEETIAASRAIRAQLGPALRASYQTRQRARLMRQDLHLLRERLGLHLRYRKDLASGDAACDLC